MGFDAVPTPDLPPAGQFSHVVRKGNLVFVSGQVAVAVEGGADEALRQGREVFEYLRSAMEAAGGSMADIVKLNVYLSDRAHFAAIRELRPQYFEPPYPAATTVVVEGMVKEGLAMEIEAIAILD